MKSTDANYILGAMQAFDAPDKTHPQISDDEFLKMVKREAAVLVAEPAYVGMICNIAQRHGIGQTVEDVLERAEKRAQKKYGALQKLTIELLEDELVDRNITLRWNRMLHDIEVRISGVAITEEQIQLLPLELKSDFVNKYTCCTRSDIEDNLTAIALRNRYHPVIEHLASAEWDGTDRFDELFAAMGLDENDVLSRRLIRKWFAMGVALLKNDGEDAYGADGCLLLYGKQGIGKTQFLSHFAMRRAWFMEGGRIDAVDKDHQRRVLCHFISELGEVQATFRHADIELLKAFITQSKDEYRLPYAKRDSKCNRHTLLAATANGTDFLRDETGNRRFWCVPCGDGFDIARIKKIDATQIWKQVEAELGMFDTQSFRLIPDEQAALERRNSKLLARSAHEDEVLDALYEVQHTDGCELRPMTVSAWMEYVGLKRGNLSAEKVGKALSKAGYSESKVAKIGGKPTRLRMLPWSAIPIKHAFDNLWLEEAEQE